MMEYEQLRAALDGKLAANPALRAILKRINGGTATFNDTAEYARVLSHILGRELSDSVLELSDRESIASQLLHDCYDDINRVCTDTQMSIDEAQGLHIKPQKATFPRARVQQFAHSLTDPTVKDSVIKRRAGAGSETITKSFHDNFIEKNVKFRNDAGLKCHIIRIGTKCCDWCTEVAGKYEMGDQPEGIFRRHDNCDCTIIYDGQVLRGKLNDNGRRSRTWEEVPNVNAEYSPPVLADGKAIEQRNLARIRGLTNGKDNDKINYARAIDSMFYADDYEYKTYTKEEIIENLKTSVVGLETIQYLEGNPQVKVKLSEDTERSDRGEHDKNLLTIWLNNCPNVRVAGQTVVHEVTHHKYGIGGSQQAEAICFAFEKMHKENRKYLTQEEWDTLTELSKTVYWDLPAVGGVDNLERFDFIVKKG